MWRISLFYLLLMFHCATSDTTSSFIASEQTTNPTNVTLDITDVTPQNADADVTSASMQLSTTSLTSASTTEPPLTHHGTTSRLLDGQLTSLVTAVLFFSDTFLHRLVHCGLHSVWLEVRADEKRERKLPQILWSEKRNQRRHRYYLSHFYCEATNIDAATADGNMSVKCLVV